MNNIETIITGADGSETKLRLAGVVYEIVGSSRPDKGVTFAQIRTQQKLLDYLESIGDAETFEPDEAQLKGIKTAFAEHVWPDVSEVRDEAVRIGETLGIE